MTTPSLFARQLAKRISTIHQPHTEADVAALIDAAVAELEAERERLRAACEAIACDWCGIGTCPQCGLEHGATYPKPTEAVLRQIARAALAPAGDEHGA